MKYIIQPCQWSSVEPLIITYHYLHRMPSGIMQCFILTGEDGISPLGAAVFSNGRVQYSEKFIDFSRLWVDDECPRNTESYFVACCMKYLKKKYPDYLGVVTWADPAAGHDGTLYKACNFSFDGMSREVKKYYDEFTKKIVYQRSNLGQSGLTQIKSDPPKLRFIYYFDNKTREETRAANAASAGIAPLRKVKLLIDKRQ